MSDTVSILGGALSAEVVQLTPELLNLALSKGEGLLAGISDPAVKAALSAMLGELATPAAKAVLTQVAKHEMVTAVAYAGLKVTGEARAAFIGDPLTSFSQRHALLDADDQATRQAAQERASLEAALEDLALNLVAKGGAAALPFLLTLL